MRRLYAVLLMILTALPTAAAAQEGPIQETISNQLSAMAAGDFAAAFSYASPTIKGMFATPDRFEAMVRSGYPMVANHRDIRMLELRTVAGNLWQRVMITDTAGTTHLLDYMMVQNDQGWQINAVQLLPSAGVSA